MKINEKLNYILKEIKKAEKNIIKANQNYDKYLMTGNNKYLSINYSYAVEAEEILSNLEISVKIIMEEENE